MVEAAVAVVGEAAAVEAAVATRARLIRIAGPHKPPVSGPGDPPKPPTGDPGNPRPAPIPIVTARLVSRAWFNCGI